jgi:glycogen debranching enzyme
MDDGIMLVHQGAFAVLDDRGDIREAGRGSPDGFFVRDARHLSRWTLEVGEVPLLVASPGVLVPEGTRDRPPAYRIERHQAVGTNLLAEHLRVVNHTATDLTVGVGYRAAADFADQFELRADDRDYDKPGARHSWEPTPGGVRFDYRREGWHSATTLAAEPVPHEVGECEDAVSLAWALHVPAHGSAALTVTVLARPADGPTATGPAGVVSPSAVEEANVAEARAFLGDVRLGARNLGSGDLARSCEQGLSDLAELRVPATGTHGETLLVPGAGVPWFLTLFGRDPLLASYFALPYLQEPAAATLSALARLQGESHDAARREEPGKIVHEVRHGELSRFGQVPYARYYGSVDATPLFLILLHAFTEWSGDAAMATRLQDRARAAVDWMFADGGIDRHGYLVYTPDPSGLANHCWKDSADAICFRDGTPARGALAVCEVQGYAYDALCRTARLARRHWNDPALASRLEDAATALRTRFLRDFPLDRADGFPALALDGEGRRVDALASNAGHLLWSGMLPPHDGERVGRRLMASDFFSGWGVRTLAAGQPAFHPLSYHRGSVWPHDNAVIALGLARYGLWDELARLTEGLVAAGTRQGYRLPEVLAGLGRDETPDPIVYPHSCSPQAWSTTTPLALLTAKGGHVP